MIEQKHVLLSMREGHVAGMLLFIRNFRIVQTEGVGQKWPHRTIKDKIIAENLVKIKNIRENFSKSSDFICLFAKISVSLQRIL